MKESGNRGGRGMHVDQVSGESDHSDGQSQANVTDRLHPFQQTAVTHRAKSILIDFNKLSAQCCHPPTRAMNALLRCKRRTLYALFWSLPSRFVYNDGDPAAVPASPYDGHQRAMEVDMV